MNTTENKVPSNADVLPFIERLGPVPAVLRDYEDNMVGRDKTGLTVYLNFNRMLNEAEAQDAGKYCAAAFNLFGFQNVQAAPSGQQQGYAGYQGVRLHVADADIPGEMRVAHKRYDYELDVLEKADSIGHRWVALRTIRQAAALA